VVGVARAARSTAGEAFFQRPLAFFLMRIELRETGGSGPPAALIFAAASAVNFDNLESMAEQRTAWDSRYLAGSHGSRDPDRFLVQAYEEFIEPLFPRGGTAFDVAGGAGRHAIWLAQRGWQVTSADISPVGVSMARERAGSCAAKIDFQVSDLAAFKASQTYDLVLVFFYLQREIFPQLAKAVRPGGLLVYKTYTHLQPKFGGGPTHPMHLLRENELPQAFSGLALLHYHETLRDRGTAEFVGLKKRRK
jgi:tellurite methyltransferase